MFEGLGGWLGLTCLMGGASSGDCLRDSLVIHSHYTTVEIQRLQQPRILYYNYSLAYIPFLFKSSTSSSIGLF